MFISGQGFADKRKKKIQYEYLKMMKKEKRQKEKSASFLPHDVENKEKPVDKDEKYNLSFVCFTIFILYCIKKSLNIHVPKR